MAKLKPDKIIEKDLLEYLNLYSDFSFELSVLKMLRERSVECEHGGHYEDPVTNKSREFDIRGIKTILQYRVRMAIECKNIGDNFPVLVSCIPRQEQESYHDIALVSEPSTGTAKVTALFNSRASKLRIRGTHSLYKAKEPVGKSTVQVGRAANTDSNITTNDSELYDKWGQCLSSAHDLVHRVYWDGRDDHQSYRSAVFPFVVVPNGRLWVVIYDPDGNRVCDPAITDRVSCFIGKDYLMGDKMANSTLRLSHLEIVTYDGLTTFVDKYLSSEEGIRQIFPKEGIAEAYGRPRRT